MTYICKFCLERYYRIIAIAKPKDFFPFSCEKCFNYYDSQESEELKTKEGITK